MYDNLDTSNRVYLIYCDIGNYRHWVKESTSPDKFFSNYDKLKNSLEELTNIDYKYNDPTPQKELEDLINNEQIYIQDFLKRYWLNAVSEAAKLKTETGKKKHLQSYFTSLTPYENRFDEGTTALLKEMEITEPDYTVKKISKQEKDIMFFNNYEKSLNDRNYLMDNIENSDGNYAWFYKNKSFLSKLMNVEIDDNVFYDITRLLLVGETYQKAARFISIKYNFSRKFSKELYLASLRMIWARRDFVYLHKRVEEDPTADKYIITTHAIPCTKCQQFRGDILNINGAIMGINFPPFCKHGCSTASLYIEKIFSPEPPLTPEEKLYSKVYYLFEDERYEEAAQQALLLAKYPKADRYAEYLATVIAKTGRLEEALAVLSNYIYKCNSNNIIVPTKIIEQYKKLERQLERKKKIK